MKKTVRRGQKEEERQGGKSVLERQDVGDHCGKNIVFAVRSRQREAKQRREVKRDVPTQETLYHQGLCQQITRTYEGHTTASNWTHKRPTSVKPSSRLRNSSTREPKPRKRREQGGSPSMEKNTRQKKRKRDTDRKEESPDLKRCQQSRNRSYTGACFPAQEVRLGEG